MDWMLSIWFLFFLSVIKMFNMSFLRHLECSGQLSFPECLPPQLPVEYKFSALLWNWHSQGEGTQGVSGRGLRFSFVLTFKCPPAGPTLTTHVGRWLLITPSYCRFHAEVQGVLLALTLPLPTIPETIPLSLAAGVHHFLGSLCLPGACPCTQHSSWQSPAPQLRCSLTFATGQATTRVGGF